MKKSSKFLQSSKDMIHRSFKPEKCKTSLRLVISRLKLLRNKKEAQVKQMRREVAQLLESGQNQTARIRVEHVVREEKTMAAYELIALYSELIMSRLPIIESQKNCPIDLKEAITSVVFASPRCGDVPELDDVRKQFSAKYGKDFISAAIELRPDSGVSRMLVEKLSARAPDGQTKVKILTAIAEEHDVEWDPKSFGENDMMTGSDLLSGPTTFEDSKVYVESPRYEASNIGTSQNQMHRQTSKPEQNTIFSQGTGNSYYDTKVHTEYPPYEASNIGTPQSQMHKQTSKPEDNTRFSHGTGDSYYTRPGNGGPTISSTSQHEVRDSAAPIGSPVGKQSLSREGSSSPLVRKTWNMEFKDAASAAQAAAESAEQASMAARAAAELANRDRDSNQYFNESQRSGVHLQQDNTAEKHSSRKLAGQQFPKDTTSSINTDRQPRSQNEQVHGVVYDSFGGADGKFDHSSYGSTEMYSQPTSLRSNASVDDSSFAHGTREDDYYPRKNLRQESTEKPESITKKLSGKSEYASDHEGSRPETFDYIQEKNTVKHSITSSRLHSNIYGDDNDSSDFNNQKFDTHGVADHFSASDQQRIYRDISQPGISGSASALSDKSGSDDDKILYDTGPKYDEPDSDFDYLSLGRTSPSNVFTKPDAWDSGFSNSRSPKKSVFSQQNSSEKHSSHEFSEVLTAPVSDLKLDDSVSMKYDDSDGLNSESEDSIDESRQSMKNYSAKVPGKENEIHKLHQRPLVNLSPDEVEFAEVPKMNYQNTGPHSDSSKNFYSSQSPDQPLQKVRKSKLDLNEKELAQFDLSLAHEDEDKYRFDNPSKEIVDDETLTRANSNVGSKLDFGKLTGGLRHKGYALPPYTRRQLDDVSNLLEKPAEESSSKKLESPAAEFPSYSRANVDADKKTSLREQNSVSDSDTDSSEDELPVQTATHRKPFSQNEGKETETKSRLKGSVRYTQVPESRRKGFLESDSEEDLPKPTFSRRNNFGSGLSRRTKATPAGTSKVQPPHEESRNSDSGAQRKSASSSYSAQSLEEPESQTRSSGQSRNSDQSSSAEGSFEPMPNSKMSLRQESLKSSAIEQPSSTQQKVDAIDSSKSSQVSLSKRDTLKSVDSSKKPSHVHPKLPDYDNLLESLRKNRQ